MKPQPTPPLNPRSAELMAFLTGNGGPKYRNRKVEVDGIKFASQAEASRYGRLKLRERAGDIAALEVHPKYVLTVKGVKLGTYTADFRYVAGNGDIVVEDVKGAETQLFRWKARHMLAEHGVKVELVR